MKPLKDKVSITLDADIIQRIKELAEQNARSFSQYINMVLRNWINKGLKINAKPEHIFGIYVCFLFLFMLI